MRRSHVLAIVTVAVISATSPVQAAPILVLGLIAAGAAGIAAAANQDPGGKREVWDYTDKYGWVGGAPEDVSTLGAPLAPRPGASQRLVSACRDAIAKNAERFDVASLEAVAAGKQSRVQGRTVVPVEVRAVYKVRGVHEVKRSKVRCELDRAGRVVATS